MDAALIMRDRETDSWWSIMTGSAIGGELDGSPLKEIADAGTKTTWGEWRKLHPDTKVLSVDGAEHSDRNPYENYFTSDGTFRDLKIDDDRLEPKANIFAFRYSPLLPQKHRVLEKEFAVPHSAIEGGKWFPVTSDDGEQGVWLYREPGVSMFASTQAYLVTRSLASSIAGPEDAAKLAASDDSVRAIAGFDTFWYTWVAVNSDTEVLQ